MTTVTTATNTREFKRAPTNLSQEESELVSAYAMVAMELTDAELEDEELESRTDTKMTTMNMQIETGVMILIISSPRDSRMLVDFVFWAIGCSKTELILVS